MSGKTLYVWTRLHAPLGTLGFICGDDTHARCAAKGRCNLAANRSKEVFKTCARYALIPVEVDRHVEADKPAGLPLFSCFAKASQDRAQDRAQDLEKGVE